MDLNVIQPDYSQDRKWPKSRISHEWRCYPDRRVALDYGADRRLAVEPVVLGKRNSLRLLSERKP